MFTTQIIGFGPAAVGLFVAADRCGVFDKFLDSGIAIIEKNDIKNNWGGLQYRIVANSPSKDFLYGISNKGHFRSCFKNKAAIKMLSSSSSCLPLHVISDFLYDLADSVLNEIEKNKNCSFHMNRCVVKVVEQKNGVFISYDENDHIIAKSNTVVVATGAIPRTFTESDTTKLAKHFNCDEVLRGKHEEKLLYLIRRGDKILIRGGSHSAFATAEYLLELSSGKMQVGQLNIIYRSRIRQFYSNRVEAGRLEEGKRPDLVNSETGEVNKFVGLRGPYKSLYRNILQGQERRIKIVSSDQHATTDFEHFGVVIDAIGYTPRLVSIEDSFGRRHNIKLTNGNVVKNSITGEIESHEGLKGVYGLGLGFADMGSDGAKVGINFFHGDSASLIISQILKAKNIPGRESLKTLSVSS